MEFSIAQNDINNTVADPQFEITTTMNFGRGLADSKPERLGPPESGGDSYLLFYSIQRLYAAASEFSWDQALILLQQYTTDGGTCRLASEIQSHIIQEHGKSATEDPQKRFIIRLAIKKDGNMSFMSAPRAYIPTVPYYPVILPWPESEDNNKDSPVIPIYLDMGATTISPLTRHKTTYRDPYNEAWTRAGLDFETVTPAQADVLLQNSNREIMGAAFRTVYFLRNGKVVTPREESGCKLSVSRRWALEYAGVEEAIIQVEDIHNSEGIWLSSAVGGFLRGKITLKNI